MIITKKRLRRIIREALIRESMEPGSGHASGYMVPNFETEEDMMLFLDELEPDDPVNDDVVNPETGEVVVAAGDTPLDAGLVELEPEEPVETEEDELDHYDWDAWEREEEARRQEQQDKDDQFQKMLSDQASAGGADWAMDTLHDAKNNPNMWEQYGAQTAVDYVLAFGQDAAGDVAQSLEYSFDSNEMHDWYDALPNEEQTQSFRDNFGRPTKQTLKDIYADNFYDGVSKAIEKARKEVA